VRAPAQRHGALRALTSGGGCDAAVPVDPDMDGPGVKLCIGLDWLF
jgi:hypothetical protein